MKKSTAGHGPGRAVFNCLTGVRRDHLQNGRLLENERVDALTNPRGPVLPPAVAPADGTFRPVLAKPPAVAVRFRLPPARLEPKLPATRPLRLIVMLNVLASAGPKRGARALLAEKVIPF